MLPIFLYTPRRDCSSAAYVARHGYSRLVERHIAPLLLGDEAHDTTRTETQGVPEPEHEPEPEESSGRPMHMETKADRATFVQSSCLDYA